MSYSTLPSKIGLNLACTEASSRFLILGSILQWVAFSEELYYAMDAYIYLSIDLASPQALIDSVVTAVGFGVPQAWSGR